MRARHFLAGGILAAAASLGAAGPAFAAGPVVVEPDPISPGGQFAIFDGGGCNSPDGVAGFHAKGGGGGDLPSVRLASLHNLLGGFGTVPKGARPGTYEVTIKCAKGREKALTGSLTVQRDDSGHGDHGSGGYGGGDQGKTDQGKTDQGKTDQGKGDPGKGDQGRGDQGRGDHGSGSDDHGKSGDQGKSDDHGKGDQGKGGDRGGDQGKGGDHGKGDQGKGDQGKGDQRGGPHGASHAGLGGSTAPNLPETLAGATLLTTATAVAYVKLRRRRRTSRG
jgi:hypothetical protein